MTIDAHHHLWEIQRRRVRWITPEQRVNRQPTISLPEDLADR